MTTKTKMNGLVLIPAYNEDRKIGVVVRASLAYLPVLVVDDGSADDTAKQAELAGAEVLSYPENQGKGAALKAGIQFALDQNCDFVITLDSDGQHDPIEIPLFLEAFASKQGDLIIGKRNFSKMPLVRRISNTLGTGIFSWAVRRSIVDNQSGYRLISRRLLEVLHQSSEQGYEFEVEMIVYCIKYGFSLDWVPIRTIYADEKSHIKALRHLLKFLQVSLRARNLLELND